MPGEGRIAALAIVTVASEPLPGGRVARAPGLAGASLLPESGRRRRTRCWWRPRRLRSPGARPSTSATGCSASGPEDEAPAPDAGPVPASLVEHWTVLVEERRWLLAMELMVQPPEWWDAERDALELPFRSLELI